MTPKKGNKEERVEAVLDRIVDGETAVLLVGEEEEERILPLDRLPTGVSEGDWLALRFEGENQKEIVQMRILTEKKKETKRRIQSKLDRMKMRQRSIYKNNGQNND